MHAVVVKVSVSDGPVATEYLRETIVPAVSQAPGFVAGYWVRLGGDEGTRSSSSSPRMRPARHQNASARASVRTRA
jgi:hypothetical protein